MKLPSVVFTDTEPFLLLNKRGKHLTLIASTTHKMVKHTQTIFRQKPNSKSELKEIN